jgi:predicted transcriptional regulator
MDYLLQLLKAVSNERRIKILEYLIEEGEKELEEISHDLKIPYATCCRNLKVLEKVYLISSKTKNAKVYYKLKNPKEHPFKNKIIELIKLHINKK